MPTYHLYPSMSRGHVDHGWLKSAHTFSFGSYYDPDRISFGALRVINDDEVAPGMGFGTHPHDNMEIITIPLAGALEHKDNIGNQSVIRTGEVQVMSAGSGVTHSEFNASKEEWVKLFQIWIMTNQPNVAPRYDQKKFDFSQMNQWIPIVQSIKKATEALGIHQDVQLCIATISIGESLTYDKLYLKNKVFVMCIEGSARIDGHVLNSKDGIGIDKPEHVICLAITEVRLLVMEIPNG